jgi:hypothetical protein
MLMQQCACSTQRLPNFSCAEFAEGEIPRWAILSRTWGRDGDEVAYKDIIDGARSGKAGYDKHHFCAVQAKEDGLDKSNNADLSEAIISMFRCYMALTVPMINVPLQVTTRLSACFSFQSFLISLPNRLQSSPSPCITQYHLRPPLDPSLQSPPSPTRLIESIALQFQQNHAFF